MSFPGLSDRLASVLDRPIVATFGTTSPDGSPHLAAVWYAAREADLIVVTAEGSRKAANVRANPVAELCVNAGPVGPCVTAHGGARIAGPASLELILDLAVRYLGEEGGARYLAARDPDARSVVLALSADRWRIWDVGEGSDEPGQP